MQLNFVKMQGAGNQIVVVDERERGREPPSASVLRVLGTGADAPDYDQLMWVGPAMTSGFAASYRVFNADGSEVEQCGNGIRCVAHLIAREDGQRRLLFDGPTGPIEARVLDDDRISVNMGPPEFEPERVPFVADAQADRYELDVNGERVSVAVLSMGNPHCVIEVEDVGTAPVERLGPLIEHHPRFPAYTNVGFMQLCDRRHIDLRVFERGVGETLACGTGACAAAVTGRVRGQLEEDVTVHLPGGQLMVSWARGDAPVWLTGDAEWISEGTIEL